MLKTWQERKMFTVSEQQLIDEASQICKKKWLSDLEIEKIQRTVEEGVYVGVEGTKVIHGDEEQVDQE